MNNERSGEFSEFLAAKAEQVERQWNDCMANSVLTALTEGGNESRHHRSASVTLYAQRDAVMRLVSNTMAGFRKDAIDATKELADLRAQLAAAKAEVERKDARIRMLTIELDGAVNHHDYTRNKVDRALGEPRFNDCDIWTAFERAIATKDATIAAQAAEIERLKRDMSDAAMLIRRLAYRCPGLAVAHQANDWLKRKGLQGSVLREMEDLNG